MYVKVRVIPGGKKESVVKADDTHYEMVVKEKAQANRANNRIRQILSEEFGVTIGSVRLVTGHRSPSKVFDIALQK